MEAGTLPRPAAVVVGPPPVRRLSPDARLVSLIREGETAAFEALYDRHHRAILSFCRHLLGDAHEAEDAVQHTFMAAYRELVSTSKEISVRPWLFTIARNRCYSILRARRDSPTDDVDQVSTENLSAEVQRREDLRALLSDIAALPQDQRAALVLSEIDALSHTEIAGVLGVRSEKVKALVFQARSSLIADRTARETPCQEIRELLSTARGPALRRANLRRHLRDCDGCRDFQTQIERQRRRLRLLLPVAPSLALKEVALGAALLGGGSAGGGLVLGGALKGGVLKGLLATLAVSAGTAGTAVIVATGALPFSHFIGAARSSRPLGYPHRDGHLRSPAAPRSLASAASLTGRGAVGAGGAPNATALGVGRLARSAHSTTGSVVRFAEIAPRSAGDHRGDARGGVRVGSPRAAARRGLAPVAPAGGAGAALPPSATSTASPSGTGSIVSGSALSTGFASSPAASPAPTRVPAAPTAAATHPVRPRPSPAAGSRRHGDTPGSAASAAQGRHGGASPDSGAADGRHAHAVTSVTPTPGGNPAGPAAGSTGTGGPTPGGNRHGGHGPGGNPGGDNRPGGNPGGGGQ